MPRVRSALPPSLFLGSTVAYPRSLRGTRSSLVLQVPPAALAAEAPSPPSGTTAAPPVLVATAPPVGPGSPVPSLFCAEHAARKSGSETHHRTFRRGLNRRSTDGIAVGVAQPPVSWHAWLSACANVRVVPIRSWPCPFRLPSAQRSTPCATGGWIRARLRVCGRPKC